MNLTSQEQCSQVNNVALFDAEPQAAFSPAESHSVSQHNIRKQRQCELYLFYLFYFSLISQGRLQSETRGIKGYFPKSEEGCIFKCEINV